MVASLNIYGRNVVTTEGGDWRHHRKITSRPFSEKNNLLVHNESIRQANQMMKTWEDKAVDGKFVLKEYILI
jgi:cytochrome P450